MRLQQYIVAGICCLVVYDTIGQNNPPQSLKDSLLLHYTMEELRAMSPEKRWNIIRELRGQLPTEPSPSIKEFDHNGIKIVKEIPAMVTSEIDSRIMTIQREKDSYRQEVFPNAYADVLQHYFRAFYSSIRDRDFDTVRYSYYKEPLQPYQEMEDSEFSNASRRTYYFSKEGALRLIELEVGYNINDGKKFEGEENLVYIYKMEKNYIWNDTLIYFQGLTADQPINTEPSFITLERLDTTKVDCKELKIYYYKNNGYKVLAREGNYSKQNWREKIELLPFEEKARSGSNGAIWFRNYWLEYQEYQRKENDYLQPVPTSFLKPYIIEGKH